MVTSSSTGGYLQPAAQPAPLEGPGLVDFIQAWLVGVSGLPGDMVRPSYPTEPPNVPEKGVVWMAFALQEQPSDAFPPVVHLQGVGDELQRQEDIGVLCSFYDTGVTGAAASFARRTRDGAAIAQNLEPLTQAGFVLGYVEGIVPIPSLLKLTWLYRVDLPMLLRRQVNRVYPVEEVQELTGSLTTDAGLKVSLTGS